MGEAQATLAFALLMARPTPRRGLSRAEAAMYIGFLPRNSMNCARMDELVPPASSTAARFGTARSGLGFRSSTSGICRSRRLDRYCMNALASSRCPVDCHPVVRRTVIVTEISAFTTGPRPPQGPHPRHAVDTGIYG